jgi:DUF1009 family protein
MRLMGPAVRPVPNNLPIALFAGKGDLPCTLVDVFQSQNRPFVVIAFKGQTEETLVKNVPHVWVSFGEAGKIRKYIDENKVKEIVMGGTISRPALSEVKPDWEGIKWLAKIGAKALGDDNLLKSIINMIEEQGYRVVGPDTILNDLLAPEGILTSSEPDEQAWRDIGRGVEVLSALGPVDVGQAVVVQEGLVLGVEAIEGTDALIKRAGDLRRPGLGGILIKIAKLQQEKRVDLPTIGLETIYSAGRAGLRGIAFEAGRTLFLNQKEAIQEANQKGLFLVGLSRSQCHTKPL